MNEPWKNDPIVKPAAAETEARQWEKDPLVAVSDSPAPWEQDPIVGEEEDTSTMEDIGTFLAELPGRTMLGGVRDAVQSILDLPEDFGLTGELPDLPEVPEPSTMGGRMARDVTQFLTGFVPVFGWLGKGAKLGKITRGMVAGAAADFAVFSGQEERLSNLIEEQPALKNPVTEFLASDPGDSAAVGRFKGALEGLALGVAGEGLFAGLRTLRGARKAKIAAKASPEAPIPSETGAAGNAAAEAAPKVADQFSVHPGARRFQWMRNKEGGQKFGNHEVILPLDEALYNKYVRPLGDKELYPLTGTPQKGLSFREYQKLDPTLWEKVVYPKEPGAGGAPTFISLRKTALESEFQLGDVLWPEQIDTLDRSKWAKEVKSFDEPGAIKFGNTADSEAHSTTGAAGSAATAATEGAPVPASSSPPAGLTPEDMFTPIDPDIQIRGSAEAPREVRVAANLNLDRIDSLEAIKNMEDVIARSEGGFEQARERGRVLGGNYTDEQRTMVAESAGTLMGDTARALGGSDVDKLRFYARLTQHTAIVEQAAGSAAEAAARLQAYKKIMKVTLNPEDIKAVKETIDQLGGADMMERKAFLLGKLNDLVEFNNKAKEIWEPKTIDKVLEGWRAGLLSGFPTTVRNMGSNHLVLAYSMPERFVGAAYGRMSGGERILFRETTAFARGALKAMSKAAGDAWEVFWREGGDTAAEKFVQKHVPGVGTGEIPTFGPSKIDVGRRHAIGGNAGFVTRGLFRALDAQDVWAKNLIYGGEMEALALRKAVADGFDGDELGRHVAEILADPPKKMVDAAHDRANAFTFTKPLREQEGIISTLAEGLTKAAAKNPGLGFVAPFIRTPANILKFGLERTPFGFAMKDMRNALKAGGVARQEAMAKITLGSSFMAAAAGLAYNGQLTGNGPTNPSERRLWRVDHQPYSFKIGDQWISYDWAEPAGMLFGMGADIVEIGKRLHEDEWDKVAMLATMAAANVFTNKTFMQGPTAVIAALNDPERSMSRTAQQFIASFVPTGVAIVARAIDPTMRDVRSVWDKIFTRIPGATFSLSAAYNGWGQEIRREGGAAAALFSPSWVSTDHDDKVTDEMLRLQVPFGMPSRNINGHDLTPEQNVEYIKLSRRPAKKLLDTLVVSPGWKEIPDYEKGKQIEAFIAMFGGIARKEMMGRYPELAVPARIQEQMEGMAPPPRPETPEERETSAVELRQAELTAAHTGLTPVLEGGRTKPVKGEELERNVTTAARGLVSAKSIGYPERPKKADTERAVQLATDPERMQAMLLDQPGALDKNAPQAFTARFQALQRASAFLAERLPKSSDPPSMHGPEAEIPAHLLDKWERTVAAVADPFSVVDDLRRGRLDETAMEAVSAVYPALFDRIRAEVAEALADQPEALPYERRLVLGALIGAGLEPSLTPRFVASMQATFAAPPQAQTPAPERQQLTRSEQRKKSRNISLGMAERMRGGNNLSTPIQEIAQS